MARKWRAGKDQRKSTVGVRDVGNDTIYPGICPCDKGFLVQTNASIIEDPHATNSYGIPWTSDGFRTSWGKLRDRAGIRDLTFHDLRGSAVVRLALAGASVPEIATFTGHSLADVESILDRHYLGRDVKLAESAVKKLERNEKRTKATKRLQNASKGETFDPSK